MTSLREFSIILAAAILIHSPGVSADPGGRRTIPLDGTWEIAEGSRDRPPEGFDRRAPVPGLADMAEPPFAEVGVKSKLRESFWYRRAFSIQGEAPAVAVLKIHKACYGVRVLLNGDLIGEHLPSFTPGLFDLRGRLRGGGAENVLIVGVGAFRDSVPESIPSGWDFEKVRYIPGIFDSVEVILSGTPHVTRLQVAPDIEGRAARTAAVLRNDGLRRAEVRVEFEVREAASGKAVGSARSDLLNLEPGEEKTVDLRVPIAGPRLWSPEDPFLYELRASTGSDETATRFGMRSFRLDRDSGRAVLNGRTCFLRGSNVCIYRFFEDPARGDRPWREEWVRRLHRVFKGMGWNALRYCIGFPPEAWYRIADEEGILIQDEFPIWYLGEWPAALKRDELVREYSEWIRERANHPCVVIWDAQNETVTKETGAAIEVVRSLDLSGRPWDNGWSPPAGPGDAFESHPYLFQNPGFRFSGIARVSGTPGGNAIPNQTRQPIIINEYGWLWLNRDGTPTTLTREVYRNLLGDDASPAARRRLYARYLAAKTEFWRCRRACAGVLHFCGLGYSRPGGQTSDHFTDIEKLTLEPEFEERMRDAFAPVGLLLDLWDEEILAGSVRQVPVRAIDDLETPWKGSIRLQVLREDRILSEESKPCEIPSLGGADLVFDWKAPDAPGLYVLEAALLEEGKAMAKPVRSIREVTVITEEERRARSGIAVGKAATASSSIRRDGAGGPEEAVDGNTATRWSSEFSDPQWIAVDIGEETEFSRIELVWEAAFGKAYRIQVSPDGASWKDVFAAEDGKGGVETIRFEPVRARWVRLLGTRRGTPFGYSLWELRVFR